jgi:hypothetical protein
MILMHETEWRIHFKGFVAYTHSSSTDPQSYYTVTFPAYGYGAGQVLDAEHIDDPELVDGRASIMGVSQEYDLTVIVGMFARRAGKGYRILGRLQMVGFYFVKGFGKVITYAHRNPPLAW